VCFKVVIAFERAVPLAIEKTFRRDAEDYLVS
jgi:hypothetical protein